MRKPTLKDHVLNRVASHVPNLGPSPKRGRIATLAMAFAACLSSACAECPESDGNFYLWQLASIHDDVDHLIEVADQTGMTNEIITTNDNDIELVLENAEAAGVKLTPVLVNWGDAVTADGNFDFEAWEEEIRKYESLDLSRFIENGTFSGVLILDDLGNFTDEGPDSATLDKMARIIKEVFNISYEAFRLIVREDATDLLRKHNDHEFEHITDVYVQTSKIKSHDGLEDHLDREDDAAAEIGLWPPIHAVNLLNWELPDADGNCPSGYVGPWEGEVRCVISPEDLAIMATVFSERCTSGGGGWKVSDESEFSQDWSFLYQEPYSSALQELAAAAK